MHKIVISLPILNPGYEEKTKYLRFNIINIFMKILRSFFRDASSKFQLLLLRTIQKVRVFQKKPFTTRGVAFPVPRTRNPPRVLGTGTRHPYSRQYSNAIKFRLLQVIKQDSIMKQHILINYLIHYLKC